MNPTFTVEGPKSHDDDWQAFLAKHEAWSRDHIDADGVLLCLPPLALRSASALFLLDNAATDAEVDFVALCRRHAGIGWCENGPLKYRWLSDPQPLPTADEMAPFLELGWSREHIDAITKASTSHENVLRRWQASAGRLVSSRKFLEARDEVRRAWTSLPMEGRPPLPLRSPIAVAKLPTAPKPTRFRGKQATFWDSFVEFCRSWQITGMATWDLPEPDGPKWPQVSAGPAEPDAVKLHSPWIFPVQRTDPIGDIAVKQHAQRSQERGVDDHGSWETYALLLPISHWQMVFATRYPKAPEDCWKI